MLTLLLWLNVWWGRFQTQTDFLYPVAQVHVDDRIFIRAEPNPSAANVGRARWGDTLLIYALQGEWGQTDEGWVWLKHLIPEPAIVHYSAILTHDVLVQPTLDVAASVTLSATSPVGVVAIFYDQALLYSSEGVGWATLTDITLTAPTDALLDFVERTAYVQVLQADLSLQPATEKTSSLPLGEAVTVMATQGDWVLVRAAPVYGWSLSSNFDLLPAVVGRGVVNISPINFRVAPVDGQVISGLDYQEPLLILGQWEDWLYVRTTLRAQNLTGWVAAKFVSITETVGEIPELKVN